MKEDRNDKDYSKADILKEMKNWIKKYNLGNYLNLGEDEVLHINEDFKKKVDKLVQDNPNGFAKYVIKILGYDNIVKGVAENIFEKIVPIEDDDDIVYVYTEGRNEYEERVKEFIKSGEDDYVDDFGNFKNAVGEYYESKELEIKKSLKTSDIADTFKVINGLQHLNWEMYHFSGKFSVYSSSPKIRLTESYKRSQENFIFTEKLYSETLAFTNKLAEIFLHKKGSVRGFDFRYSHDDDFARLDGFKNNYFDQWKIKDEVEPLSNSKRLLNDVQNYLFKKFDFIEEQYYSELPKDAEEKTR